MTEHDLRNLLLEFETASTSARKTGRSATKHGAWFVWILTAITFLLWTAALIALVAYFVGTFDWLMNHVRNDRVLTEIDVQGNLACMAIVSASLFAALLSTIVRAYAARVSRLRRINSGLFEILSQLLQHKRSEKGAE